MGTEEQPSADKIKELVDKHLERGIDMTTTTLKNIRKAIEAELNVELQQEAKAALQQAVDAKLMGQRPAKSLIEKVEQHLQSLEQPAAAVDIARALNVSKKEANSCLYKLKSEKKATIDQSRKTPYWSLCQQQQQQGGQQEEQNSETTIVELPGKRLVKRKMVGEERGIDVRVHFVNSQGQTLPTKKGIFLPKSQFQSLKEKTQQITDAFNSYE